MKPLAWALIVIVPWTAFATIFLALRRGRPRPYTGWSTEQIQRRLGELDAVGAREDLGAQARRERRQLWQELFRRGRGHEGEPSPGSTRG